VGPFHKVCSREHTNADSLFSIVETSDVPAGWTSVPVELDDDGVITNAAMVAGSVGMRISSSGTKLESGQTGVDTVQPTSGWWMYETSAYFNTLSCPNLQNLTLYLQ
jgi:hypothetical protein